MKPRATRLAVDPSFVDTIQTLSLLIAYARVLPSPESDIVTSGKARLSRSANVTARRWACSARARAGWIKIDADISQISGVPTREPCQLRTPKGTDLPAF